MHQWFCHERSMGWKWRYRRWYGRDRVDRRAVRSGGRGFGLAIGWRRRIHPFHSQSNEQAVNVNKVRDTSFQFDVMLRNLAGLFFHPLVGHLQVFERLGLLFCQKDILADDNDLAYNHQTYHGKRSEE